MYKLRVFGHVDQSAELLHEGLTDIFKDPHTSGISIVRRGGKGGRATRQWRVTAAGVERGTGRRTTRTTIVRAQLSLAATRINCL